jgi:Copper type II ascorbate-dependent monooxygenase, C-terminal domain
MHVRRGRLVGLAATALAVAAVVAAVVVHGSSSSAAVSQGATPTWQDVSPIFAAKCAGCHMRGGIAPFSLTSAQSAKAHAAQIRIMTQLGLMPPWPPGSDSPAYTGSSRRVLTAREKDLIARWARGGAPVGSGGSISPAQVRSSAPGRQLSLAPARSYTPHAAVGGLDDYHCFVLEPRLKQDVYVTSAVIRPGRPDIVHHVILFEAAGANAAEARGLNAASNGKGWTCFGGPGLAETHPGVGAAASDRLGAPEWLGAWVPGHTTNDTPKGTGVLLHAGAAIVLQVHYNLIHPARPDRSRAVLRVVPAAGSKLTRLTTMLLPAPVELPCPQGVTSPLCSRDRALADEARKYGSEAAFIPTGLLYFCGKALADYPQDVGDARAVQTSCDRTVRRPLRVYSVAGHMHLRGVDIRVELNPGTPKAQTLLHIPRWDFHWQDAYYLEKPVDVSPGDTIRVSCRYDNSAGRQPVVKGKRLAPRYVLWGEGTTDEMCLGLLQVANRG